MKTLKKMLWHLLGIISQEVRLCKVLEITPQHIAIAMLLDKEKGLFQTRMFEHEILTKLCLKDGDLLRLTLTRYHGEIRFRFDGMILGYFLRKEDKKLYEMVKNYSEKPHDVVIKDVLSDPMFDVLKGEKAHIEDESKPLFDSDGTDRMFSDPPFESCKMIDTKSAFYKGKKTMQNTVSLGVLNEEQKGFVAFCNKLGFFVSTLSNTEGSNVYYTTLKYNWKLYNVPKESKEITNGYRGFGGTIEFLMEAITIFHENEDSHFQIFDSVYLKNNQDNV